MADESRDKTAFQIDSGSYAFLKMPFGCSSAPSHFQRIMTENLRNMPFALAFIDDVLVMAKDAADMFVKLQQVFNRFRAARLRIHSEKCRFAVKRLKFLGHIFESNTIKINPDKVSIVKDYPTPKTVRLLRSFLGFSAYWRRFLKSYSQMTFPLRQFLRKNARFVWTSDCQKAFDRIKHDLLQALTLLLADCNKQSVLITDASVTGLGYALCQYDDKGQLHPCFDSGEKLNPRSNSLSHFKLEFLAIVEAVREFHVYLANQHFEVWIDRLAKSFYQSLRLSDNSRITRWVLFLSANNLLSSTRRLNSHSGRLIIAQTWPEHDRTPAPEEYLRDDIELTPDL
jgi:hypothetical protein